MQNAIACAISLTACIVKPLKHLRELLKILKPLQIRFFDLWFLLSHADDLSTPGENAPVKMGNL
jgi:hypothetical protein